jgi:hypothetical protein
LHSDRSAIAGNLREFAARWLPGLCIAWIAGVLLLSLRNFGGWLGVWRLRYVGTTPAQVEWDSIVRTLHDRMQIRQPVRVLQSSIATAPIVVGWLKPLVLLPIGIAGEMSLAQIEAVLAHELAHVRRHDYLVNLLQMVVEMLLFYHPAMWWSSRQIRREREHCCDDAAAAACGSAVELSEAIALVASRLGYRVALSARGTTPSDALGRVQRLLNPPLDPLRATTGASAVLVMLFVLLALTLGGAAFATAEGPTDSTEAPAELKAATTPAESDVTLPKASKETARTQKMAIFAMRPDGTDVHQIAVAPGHDHVETPRWSHDGKRILFTASRGELGERDYYVVNADGSGLLRLGTRGHADWSPDDSKVAFDVYTHGLASDRPDDLFTPDVLPRGSYVHSLSGADYTRISSGLCPRWSPDGSKMAVTGHKNLHVVDLATGEEKSLFANPFEYIFAGFNWSPDGKWLALSAKKGPKSPRQLLLVSADGEKAGLKLLQTSEQGGSISFSPDGKQLVFADDLLLRLIDTSGEGESRLIPNQRFHGRDPHWSPDGEWIVYAGELP